MASLTCSCGCMSASMLASRSFSPDSIRKYWLNISKSPHQHPGPSCHPRCPLPDTIGSLYNSQAFPFALKILPLLLSCCSLTGLYFLSLAISAILPCSHTSLAPPMSSLLLLSALNSSRLLWIASLI